MSELLVILSPPRSFSSVVSTMIGEHPEIYGFPELHLFLGDTVREVIDTELKRAPHYAGPPGVIRTLAMLHDGVQTTATAIRAAAWLNERRGWSTKQLMDYLLEKVAPLVGVEKSPVTSIRPQFLERAYALYPNAFYLHLTRHPLPSRNSIKEFQDRKRERGRPEENRKEMDQFMQWHYIHTNIIRFTAGLPLGQSMRIKGEDVLSQPEIFLPQIAEWMGLRTDREAIEAMMHPENSPYAAPGPQPARGGNDPKFMRNPVLRKSNVRQPSLANFFAQDEQIEWFSDRFSAALSQSPLEAAPQRQIEGEISSTAALFGYY
jgi:hypothetical protein